VIQAIPRVVEKCVHALGEEKLNLKPSQECEVAVQAVVTAFSEGQSIRSAANGKHLYSTWMKGGLAGAGYKVCQSGWMEELNYLKRFEAQFYLAVKYLLATRPRTCSSLFLMLWTCEAVMACDLDKP
jgi:hypothetical protein